MLTESVYDHQGCCVYNYLLFLSKLWCIQLGYKRAEKMFQAQIHIYIALEYVGSENKIGNTNLCKSLWQQKGCRFWINLS